ncbi:MAG: MarR family transcriptional regulator [Jatrophihabitans sp.]|nr:MarR family transcriptional regulator [Jatrophihabitans sp.]
MRTMGGTASALPSSDASTTANRSTEVAAVASNVIDLVRAFAKAKVRMMQDAEHDVDRAAHLLLRSIESNGAMRVSGLAASVGSDVSTVSRQVSALVKEGLLERRADPGDSRASLLVPTNAGRAVIARHDQIRAAFFERVLADWDVDELRHFARLLERFGDSYQRALTPEPSDQDTNATTSWPPSDRPTKSGGIVR